MANPSSQKRTRLLLSAGLPSDHLVTDALNEEQLANGPQMRVKQVTTLFFGMDNQWLRKHEAEGHLVLDGKFIGGRRDPTTARNERVYDLRDVELIVHALMSQGRLPMARAIPALKAVSGAVEVQLNKRERP